MKQEAPCTGLPDAVVDASVGIKLFVAEEMSEQAELLFASMANDRPVRLYVPDLFYVECTNILWKYVRRHGLPAEQAHANLSDLSALSLQAVPTVEIVQEALEIVIGFGATAYDACYVALSYRLGAYLITADERLVRQFAGSRYRIRWLGDIRPNSD